MWGRHDLLERLSPYRVRPSSDTPPDSWETGTLNHEGLAGFVAAVDYLAGLGSDQGRGPAASRRRAIAAGFDAIRRHEADLSRAFLGLAREVPGLRIFGIGDPDRVEERTPTFALRLGDLSPREVAIVLADAGCFVWDGNYYAVAIMERLGLEATGGAVRIGFCHYNTLQEVERVVAELVLIAASV
jgi:selenocysteine lyase/cysteine desulfurase